MPTALQATSTEAGPVDFDTFGTIYAPRGGAALAPYGTAEAYPFRGRISSEGRSSPPRTATTCTSRSPSRMPTGR